MADKKDDKKKGGGLLAVLIIIGIMYWVVGGGLTKTGNAPTVSQSGVTQRIPASGNLVPQPDNHLSER